MVKLTLIFIDGSKSASVEIADNWYHESLVRKLSRIHSFCMDMMKRGNIKTFRYEI